MVRSRPKYSWGQEKLILVFTAVFARDLCTRNHGELAELYEANAILSIVQYQHPLALEIRKWKRWEDRVVNVLKPIYPLHDTRSCILTLWL